MSESKKIQELKEDSLRLFELKDNFQEYESKATRIANKVRSFKLEHVIDPGELRFVLINPVKGKKRSVIKINEFTKSIEEYFKMKKFLYYFQLVELSNFPRKYMLGHGRLLTFDSLPKLVKDCAGSLSKDKVTSVPASMQKVWNQIISSLAIPAEPKLGIGWKYRSPLSVRQKV